MLKKIRRIIAAMAIIFVTLLFLDFTGVLHQWLGWIAKIQLIPAILAVNVVVIIALVLLTLVFGRIYCSVICPLGILQDGISYISKKRKGKKHRFGYLLPKSWLRYSVLAIFIIALLATVSSIVSILDPYAAYGRIVSNLFAPIYKLGNNLIALVSEKIDSYTFYSTEVWIKSWLTFGIALTTLITIGILAWRNGRTYCNTICPVGTLLGFLSRFSIFKLVFDKDKCTNCKLCERNCKASCINSKTMSIDRSRCVTCFNCIDNCKAGAIKYKAQMIVKKDKTETVNTAEKQDGVTRRNMLSILGLLAVTNTVKAQQRQVDGGLAHIEDKKITKRKTRIVPPGAGGLQNMHSKCTACQLCVSVCPNNILIPSNKLATLMQPEISYERGYCRPECTECSQVCPTGAIQHITAAEKSAISIGRAYWIKENCVVNTDEIQCTNCERHCPTGAITLVLTDPNNKKSLKIPTIDTENCIGCGACENLCPARPFSAIYVEGNLRHHTV